MSARKRINPKRQPPERELLDLDSEKYINFSSPVYDIELRGDIFRASISSRFQHQQFVFNPRLLPSPVGIQERVDVLEMYMKHAVQPILKQWATRMELMYEEKDPVPAASSIEYEWRDHVSRMIDRVEKILAVFDDLELRLKYYNTLIEQTRELLKLAVSIGERNLRAALIVLHNALCGTYSEDLSRTQAEVVKKAILSLNELEWDKEMVRALNRQLRTSGFETIPSDKHVDLYSERIRT